MQRKPYKKTQPKRPYKKKAPTNKQLATRVKKLEHTEELKYIDYYWTTSPFNNTTTVQCLSLMGQGDDFDQRIGEEVTAKYLNIKFRWRKGASSDAMYSRIMVFWDTQTNGSGPTLFTSGGNEAVALLDNTTVTVSALSPLNYRTHQRYHVLLDKVFQISADSSAVEKYHMIKKSIKLHNAKIKYSSSGSTVAALPSRVLFVYMISAGQAADTGNAYNNAVRVWYTDA